MKQYVKELKENGFDVYTFVPSNEGTIIVLPKGMTEYLKLVKILQRSAYSLNNYGLGYDPEKDEYALVNNENVRDFYEDSLKFKSNSLLVIDGNAAPVALYQGFEDVESKKVTVKSLVNGTTEQTIHEVSKSEGKWVIMVRSLLNKKDFYGFVVSNSQEADGLYDSIATSFDVELADSYESKEQAKEAVNELLYSSDFAFITPTLMKEDAKLTVLNVK
ncbi:hypothetical protein RND61_14875 [Streptomyces sp. TRM76323]|uniref:Uncharacterized protein n=1 Tax=Streptomyces tamarix TaxID=3078565 RepID=A0ABU3QLR8_9ACTN|nr:hypothetical protein [Streptomyces tamarix]MDT9683347.1 hypothetical protein [Streptomyces tamarix]